MRGLRDVPSTGAAVLRRRQLGIERVLVTIGIPPAPKAGSRGEGAPSN